MSADRQQMQRAHQMVEKARRRGILRKSRTCEQCGYTAKGGWPNREIVGHHPNGYDDEHALDVVWLCRSCHRRAHAKPDPAFDRAVAALRAREAAPERDG